MEASQGDPTLVRYLYRCGLEANPRSRFTYLSWGLFEKQQGSPENARALLQQGYRLNPRDAAILQARRKHMLPLALMLRGTLSRVLVASILMGHLDGVYSLTVRSNSCLVSTRFMIPPAQIELQGICEKHCA